MSNNIIYEYRFEEHIAPVAGAVACTRTHENCIITIIYNTRLFSYYRARGIKVAVISPVAGSHAPDGGPHSVIIV